MSNRSREAEQRQSGYGSEGDDGNSECAVGDRCVVGDCSYADGVEIGDADADQDWGNERPGVAEADQTFEQSAERPGEEDGLCSYIGGALCGEPAAELVEHPCDGKGVEQHDAPEGDPVHCPSAGQSTVDVRSDAATDGHLPDDDGEQEGDDGADEDGDPGGEAEDGKQNEKNDDGDEGEKPSDEEVPSRVQDLLEHGPFPQFFQKDNKMGGRGASTCRRFAGP
jgi:hypothetical protein